ILSLNIITFFPESSTSSSSELFTEPQTNNSTLHAIDSKSQAANSLPEPTKPLPILPLSFNSSSINVESLSLLSPPYTFLQSINTSKNLIFIGDVHGALPELKSLLTTIKYNPANDHLIFLGDLVAKGPSSLEVLEYVRKLSENGNIDCVRGNHDDKLLRWKFFLEALSTTGIHLNDYVNKYELPKHLRLENEHMRLASVMDKESYEFLLSCPMVIEFPDENLYAVHAGLLPNILPNEQDPMDIMNMRNIKPDGHPTKSKKQGKPWSKFWNFFQIFVRIRLEMC
ncbi:5738_t:CDS:2, partial [Acaulospora colombiana]